MHFILIGIKSDASLKVINVTCSDNSNMYHFNLGDVVSAICMDSYKTEENEYVEIWCEPNYSRYNITIHMFLADGTIVYSPCKQLKVYYFPW